MIFLSLSAFSYYVNVRRTDSAARHYDYASCSLFDQFRDGEPSFEGIFFVTGGQESVAAQGYHLFETGPDIGTFVEGTVEGDAEWSGFRNEPAHTVHIHTPVRAQGSNNYSVDTQ